MNSLLDVIFTTDFAFSLLRVTTPILFAALGALISNRAGIINIGMEGIMLVSALAGVIVSAYTQSAWVGLLGAVMSGTLIAGVLAFFTLKFKTHIILGGVAINMFASGGTVFILYLLSGDKGSSTSLASKVLPNVQIPLLKDIPVLGPILSGHHILTYVSILAVLVVYYLLNRTPLGLRIRSVGENPHAAQSVGVSVVRIQYTALLLSGFFASLGGAYMSMGYLSLFTRDMIAGRGWIAIAAESMGRSTTIGTALTSLLFGAADALSNALQVLKIPAELIATLPYVATVIGLVIYAVSETRKKNKKVKAPVVK
ncbi:ABC transporter permease [Paenibacillus sp. FSL R7-0273]|uniref:ABC transporter permease n=1 Tax=Paenibacillus sp. FSL R7-0273 TaxID=1536772 RepID=UPI0004F5ECB2|nr:ABC transporter permease [Paenibacillus sp. FSL R7-0273]AIQ49329.1 ABC transporter permease [Paenibacillus sp. FSL R7-0273]OMF87997.1 ABC transporter permease [Paenibacillus sp. FSL R7-0273]